MTKRDALTRWAAWPWAVALVVGLVGFTWLSVRLRADHFATQGIDASVNGWFLHFADASPVAVGVARVLSYLGSAGAVILVTAVLAVALRRARRSWLAAWLVLTVSSGWVLTQLAKMWSGRARPDTNGRFWTAHGASFPSGHASVGIYAFGAFAVVAVLVIGGAWRWWLAAALVLVGVSIGVSRLVLGVHWITDVLGGWLLGLAVLSASVLLLRRYATMNKPTPNAT
jgi:membrane-associated phospholipid phosphatase